MTTSSADKQMPPLDTVYRIYVEKRLSGKFGWHNQKSTYMLEDDIRKATTYNSYRAAKQAYACHYKDADKYLVRIHAYALTPLSIENLSAGT